MGPEQEAAELYLRILGEVIIQLGRVGGAAAMRAVPATVDLLVSGYMNKTGRSIVNNPSGSSIITIPSDKIEEIRKEFKNYQIKCVAKAHPDKDVKMTNLLVKNSDLNNIKVIMDQLSITMLDIQQVGIQQDDVIEKEREIISTKDNYKDVKEALFKKELTIDEALNRNNKDIKEVYYVDLDNPNSYIKLTPKVTQNELGEEVKYIDYEVTNKNKKVKTFNDDLSFAKLKNDKIAAWANVKKSIKEHLGKDNLKLGYIKNKDTLLRLQSLYNSKDLVKSKEIQIDDNKMKELTELAQKGIPIDKELVPYLPKGFVEEQNKIAHDVFVAHQSNNDVENHFEDLAKKIGVDITSKVKEVNPKSTPLADTNQAPSSTVGLEELSQNAKTDSEEGVAVWAARCLETLKKRTEEMERERLEKLRKYDKARGLENGK